MKPKQIHGVPTQEKGSYHDTESKKDFNNSEIALTKYQILEDRLLSINYWSYYADNTGADFKLHDKSGNLIKRLPEIGDFIRIEIPGSGDFEARGYDWVQIADMQHHQFTDGDVLECFLIKCQPSAVPGSEETHIAHFYSHDASTTFVISRGDHFIHFGIYGRNELPNYNGSLLERAKNVAASLGGIIDISKIQWKNLADALVNID